MVEKGIILPNNQWSVYTDEQVAALIDLRPDVLQVLVYAEHNHLDQVLKVIDLCQSIKHVDLRPYDNRIPKRDPVTWADECLRRIKPYLAPLVERGVTVGLIPDNERNYPGEAGHSDWPRHAVWLNSFGWRWIVLDPQRLVEVHLAALSPGIANYQEGYRQLAALVDLTLYTFIDVHCYSGTSAEDYALVHKLFPELWVAITEFNGIDPEVYLGRLPRYVGYATWFILSGAEDQKEYFLMGSSYYRGFKRAKAVMVPDNSNEEDRTMTLRDTYPNEFIAWEDAEGIETNFHAHLLGIGVLKPTSDDLKALAGNVRSAVEQLKDALDNFPFS